jgi:hypothetical protein
MPNVNSYVKWFLDFQTSKAPVEKKFMTDFKSDVSAAHLTNDAGEALTLGDVGTKLQAMKPQSFDEFKSDLSSVLKDDGFSKDKIDSLINELPTTPPPPPPPPPPLQQVPPGVTQ